MYSTVSHHLWNTVRNIGSILRLLSGQVRGSDLLNTVQSGICDGFGSQGVECELAEVSDMLACVKLTVMDALTCVGGSALWP